MSASLRILVTLRILNTLASLVKDESTDKSASRESKSLIRKSKTEELTTTKSN